MGDHKLAYNEQITNLIFNFKRLSAYMKNTVNSEKLTYKISTNFGPKPKNFVSLFYTLYTVQ